MWSGFCWRITTITKTPRISHKPRPLQSRARTRRSLGSPVVVTLHLVVEHLALLRGRVRDQLGLDDLQDIVADVRELGLDLRFVVADERELVALWGRHNRPTE